MFGRFDVNSFTVWALAGIHFFGINSMYGLVYRNGYYNALIQLRDHGPHVLPGSNNPIVTKFTGLRLIDRLLTLAGVMFSNVTDGTAPALSLYAFQFAGQLVPVLTVMTIEGLRHGNRRTLLQFPLVWGLFMQGLGYGFIMPIYGIVHLLHSPTAKKVDSKLAMDISTGSIPFLETLPSSMVLGYILPSILMCIPVQSSWLHQWLMATWQGFPLWVTLLQSLQGILHPRLFKALNDSRRDIPKDRIGEMMALHRAYLFAFSIATSTHLGSIAILGIWRLFPMLLSNSETDSVTFQDVFLPPLFTSRVDMKSMANGIHNFFQYDQYVGSTAAIAWAVALHCNSRKSRLKTRHWLWLAGEILGVSLIAGPGGALVALMWNRDERVIGDEDLVEDTISQEGRKGSE